MSFDYNPFRHIEVVEHEPDHFSWYCHGCGADSHRKGTTYSTVTSIGTVFSAFKAHIRNSHGRTEEEMKDWSIY